MATHPECRGTGTCRNASERIVLGRLTNRSARSGPVGGAAGPRQRTSGRRSRHQTAQRRRWRGRGGAGQRDASCCPIAGERSVESAGNVPVWLDRFAGIAGARVVAFLVVEVGRELCMQVKVKLPCWPNPRQAGLQMPSMEPKLPAAAVLLWLNSVEMLRALILSGPLPLAAVARSAENLTLASELHRRVFLVPRSRAPALAHPPTSDLRPSSAAAWCSRESDPMHLARLQGPLQRAAASSGRPFSAVLRTTTTATALENAFARLRITSPAAANAAVQGRRYASVKSQGAYRLKSKKTIAKKMGAKKTGGMSCSSSPASSTAAAALRATRHTASSSRTHAIGLDAGPVRDFALLIHSFAR